MKIWLFRSIAVLIPLVFILVLEFSLRLVNYGEEYPLFISNPTHPDYVLPRPDIVKRYFNEVEQTPRVSMEANFFLAEKPENGLRIFVQGGSTAAGYPYGLGASLAGMVEHRIRATHPTRYVEVINTAMSAVNSYTLLDFADEIIDQDPDAIFIYAGHNEYLGILGVGSNYSITASNTTTLWFLKLKELRIFQLMQAMYSHVKQLKTSPTSSSSDDASSSSRTLMSQVAKEKEIALDSDIFTAGIEQFTQNMRLLLDKYAAANIPVYISTLASNELDHPPFSSSPADQELQGKLTQLTQNIKNYQQDTLLLELDLIHKQIQQSHSADLHFELGRLCASVKHISCAKKALLDAKELDNLRFRAPQAINTIIRQLASRQGVTLVDTENKMRQRSPLGLIGRNVMLEHLHPNISGYFVLANAFYEQYFTAQKNIPNTVYVSADTAWQRRPIIPSEEYIGFADILALTSDYPFSPFPKPVVLPKPQNWEASLGLEKVQKKIDWLTMQRKALAQYKTEKNFPMVLKTQQIIADALPHDPVENLRSAKNMHQVKRIPEALYYYQRAQRAGTMNIDTVIKRLAQQVKSMP